MTLQGGRGCYEVLWGVMGCRAWADHYRAVGHPRDIHGDMVEACHSHGGCWSPYGLSLGVQVRPWPSSAPRMIAARSIPANVLVLTFPTTRTTCGRSARRPSSASLRPASEGQPLHGHRVGHGDGHRGGHLPGGGHLPRDGLGDGHRVGDGRGVGWAPAP